ncbi:hypothetical protein FQA39_LY08768 [Lamprigera yunnana]|nr:hypothetical protein FQA39_LY08768 [Lamprigera yunnana]
MERFEKVSYEEDFSDSSSTITNLDLNEEQSVLKDISDECLKRDNENELETIFKKYTNRCSIVNPHYHKLNDAIVLSSDDEYSQEYVNENGSEKFNDNNGIVPYNDLNLKFDSELIPKENVTEINSKSKKRKVQSNLEKEQQKMEKERQKMKKATERARKKEEAEKQKQIKQALLSANKNAKPENCFKFITAKLDSNIINEKYTGEILNSLQALGVDFKFESQIIPNTIMWISKSQPQIIDSETQIHKKDTEVDQVLLIMNWKELIELIHSNTLLTHIDSIKSILNKKKIFILIYGIQGYFNYYKRQSQKELKNDTKGNSKIDTMYENVPKVSRKQLEYALTELQILQLCCHQFLENSKDMGEMVGHLTKSIALIPYKLAKYQKQQQLDWFISGDNKDCVNVDKNGNGLKRLWQQQLVTFPLTRLEHAEAIMAKYPSLKSLIEECNKVNEKGEQFLKDLPIRRAAGPLTTVRKLGPELSKKVYTYFTAINGNYHL